MTWISFLVTLVVKGIKNFSHTLHQYDKQQVPTTHFAGTGGANVLDLTMTDKIALYLTHLPHPQRMQTDSNPTIQQQTA